MPLKKGGPKLPADRAEPSKAATAAAAEAAPRDGMTGATSAEPPAPQVHGDDTVPPRGQGETPEGVV